MSPSLFLLLEACGHEYCPYYWYACPRCGSGIRPARDNRVEVRHGLL